jgi:hypothetical protein
MRHLPAARKFESTRKSVGSVILERLLDDRFRLTNHMVGGVGAGPGF